MSRPSVRVFLEQVHRRVIRLGPREHIAVLRLLRSRPDWSVGELRAALASLLSTNPEQWDGVGNIFDQTLAGTKTEQGAELPPVFIRPPPRSARVRLDPEAPSVGERTAARLRLWIARRIEALRNLPRAVWLVAILVVLVVAILAVYLTLPTPRLATVTTPTVSLSNTPIPAPRAAVYAPRAAVYYELHPIEAARTVTVEGATTSPLDRDRERRVLLILAIASWPLALLGVRFLRLPRAARRVAMARAQARAQHTAAERERLDRERAQAGRALRIQYHVERRPALSRQAILDSAELLGRVFRVEASAELDADRTLRRTVAAAGRFTPALASRRNRQEVLVLVDVERGDHPWLGGFVRVLEEWGRQGVRLLRFDYQMSPASVVEPETRQHYKLEDLARRTEGLPLIVFSRRLSSEARAGEARWLRACGAWSLRVWVDPGPRLTSEIEPPQRRRDIDRLERVYGLRRHPLTDRGVVGLARWLADAGESPPDVPWQRLPPVPGRDDSSPLAAALRRWALAGSLVPDPTWDQLEAIRLHFPELRDQLPERRYLQLLLEWVEREIADTGEKPESEDGHGLNLPEEIQDRWLREQRKREASDPGSSGFERRVRQLLLDQLLSTRPESGELDQQWWEFKRCMHQALLDPARARERLAWVFDAAIAHDASRWVRRELGRQSDDCGAPFSRADRDALSALLEVPAKQVPFRDLWWGHWRAWAAAALTSAALLAGHTFAHQRGVHATLGDWLAQSATKAEARLPATYVVLQKTITENGGVELVRIPGGTFMMGSPSGETDRDHDEGPQREVTVPAFWLGQYEVTNQEYEGFMKANPDDVAKPDYWDDQRFNGPRQPVVGVSWEEARRFATWAGGRLPTEAEWEYAARAGTTAPYLTGSTEEDLARVAWYSKNSGKQTLPVGEKQPNAWGLHDVLGNVWEWLEDTYHKTYEGGPTDGSAWVDKGGVDRVIRGGSWYDDPLNARVAHRHWVEPSSRGRSLGFRLARSLHSGD